ncbi:MAG: NAD(P)H-dependent oxidoreductase [Sphingobacteriales bacterium]|nr:MAG: NAD(P)H-dependent oxidoreductase [Sphingobacteriales bacterium]
MERKNILVINGSASEHSANQQLIRQLVAWTKDHFVLKVYPDLKLLPHFSPELSLADTPEPVLRFRQEVAAADGVLICTPEYIFSIPGGFKNALEWCVAAPVFTEKPLGIITASANGQKGHEELQLIMQTLMANFTTDTTLLIPGIKGKINAEGIIIDPGTIEALAQFLKAFRSLIKWGE